MCDTLSQFVAMLLSTVSEAAEADGKQALGALANALSTNAESRIRSLDLAGNGIASEGASSAPRARRSPMDERGSAWIREQPQTIA